MSSPRCFLPHISTPMHDPNYWIQKCPQADNVFLTSEQIQEMNRQLPAALPGIFQDFTQPPPEFAATDLVKRICQSCPFPETSRYIDDQVVEDAYYQRLQDNMNLEIDKAPAILYGFTVRRSNIRSFPTQDFVSNAVGDRDFDRFQETILDPAQPLLVLHQSRDQQWFFIESYHYAGWVRQEDIATTEDRELWWSYLQNSRFLIVTAAKLYLEVNRHYPPFSRMIFELGAKIPLAALDSLPEDGLIDRQISAGNYVVSLPTRDHNGQLAFRHTLIPLSADVHEGYLPCSRAAIIRQAFRCQGERYGWGGADHNKDCSAFVMDVYRCFGLSLPRNAGQQEKVSLWRFPLKGLATAEKERRLAALSPGALVFLPGHVMLYLGEEGGRYYVIHNISAQGLLKGEAETMTLVTSSLNGLIVTDLSLLRSSGETLLAALTQVSDIG